MRVVGVEHVEGGDEALPLADPVAQRLRLAVALVRLVEERDDDGEHEEERDDHVEDEEGEDGRARRVERRAAVRHRDVVGVVPRAEGVDDARVVLVGADVDPQRLEGGERRGEAELQRREGVDGGPLAESEDPQQAEGDDVHDDEPEQPEGGGQRRRKRHEHRARRAVGEEDEGGAEEAEDADGARQAEGEQPVETEQRHDAGLAHLEAGLVP